MSQSPLSASAQRVRAALQSLGLDASVVEMPSTTRSAAEAAAAIGCEAAQIAKSLVFRGALSGNAILVIASGSNRVDEEKVASLTGEPIARGDADFVRQQTGFAIGGVPPVGHFKVLLTILDEVLQIHNELWAAAGTPFAVFRLSPADLQRITGGIWADVRK